MLRGFVGSSLNASYLVASPPETTNSARASWPAKPKTAGDSRQRRQKPRQKKKPAISRLPASQYGAPGRIRTSDPQVRSLVLYPAELRALSWKSMTDKRLSVNISGETPSSYRPCRMAGAAKEKPPKAASVQLAESEGFEPSIEFLTLYSLSRGAPSATRATLRIYQAMRAAIITARPIYSNIRRNIRGDALRRPVPQPPVCLPESSDASSPR